MPRKKRPQTKAYKPYQQVKMKLFELPDPFGDAPVEVRLRAIREIGSEAKVTFERKFPQLEQWFDQYDPLYILSFCLFYFLSTERGVDKEAIDGKLEFGSHHLELLQAIALMRPRRGTPEPLRGRALELKKFLNELTEALGSSSLDVPEDLSEADFKKHTVLWNIRAQTFAIRNWAFPDQSIAHMKAFCAGPFGRIVSEVFGGISAVSLVEALVRMSAEVNTRLNRHLVRLSPALRADTFESVYSAYRASFIGVKDDGTSMRQIFDRLCRGNLKTFKTMLVAHSDLWLVDIFTFSLDQIAEFYGEPSQKDNLRLVLDQWSYGFGDLDGQDPKHFLITNPVLRRPFIKTNIDTYFWVLSGLLGHTLPGLLEGIVPKGRREKYLDYRSQFLEDQVAKLCKVAFPNGEIHCGSLWRPVANESTTYENDILVIVGSTAIVIECKSNLVDPPARRGAELRLVDTLQAVAVEASAQAERFSTFLREHPRRHIFDTRAGITNAVDASQLLRFIPISVTYENLGFISANLKECVKAGLILEDCVLVPSICFTDLEIIFGTLDSQVERIHYLSRRSEIEQTMTYMGDELDLFAFYLESGFDIGSWETGEIALNLVMKSKELDPYFVARADGISIPKPSRDLSPWWRAILSRIEERRNPFWTEIAYVLLNVGRKEQDKFEKDVRKLCRQVHAEKNSRQHHGIVMRNQGVKGHDYAIIGFPFRVSTRQERNEVLNRIAEDVNQTSLESGVIIGINADKAGATYPYDVLVYFFGHGKVL